MQQYRLLLILFLAIVTASSASAQYFDRYWKGPSNMEVGYSYCVASADFKYHNKRFNESTNQLTDTGFTEHVRSKGGFGAVGGYYWPIAKLNDQSALALDLNFMYNFYLWDGELFSYAASSSGNGTTTEVSVGSGTAEIALPVGVEYKYGCDAVKDKSQKFCASFGGGVYPSGSITVFKESGGLAFRVRPYVRAEIGYFAGICFKLRATYVMSKSNYINYEDSGPGYETATTFKSTGTTVLSLIFMPFSWKWNKSRW